MRGKLFLIDCGEGTQLQIRRQGLSFDAITTIFITHLHGDHTFGLPGLIATMSMLGRGRALTIVGPRDSKRVLGGILGLTCDWIGFHIDILEYDDRVPQLVWQDRSITVHSIPLMHRMPTQGYVFREQCAERHIDRAACDFYGVPRSAYPALLRGEAWSRDSGDTIANDRLTRPGRRPRSYAVCTDTKYIPELAERLRGTTLLYHEATFLTSEEARAQETHHSTARQAALVAQAAGVDRLLIGHYSARYHDTAEHLAEAQAIFPHTTAASEGMVIDIP